MKIALIDEDKMNTNEEENNSGTTNTIQTLVYFSLGYLIGLSAEENNSGTTNTIQTLVHFREEFKIKKQRI